MWLAAVGAIVLSAPAAAQERPAATALRVMEFPREHGLHCVGRVEEGRTGFKVTFYEFEVPGELDSDRELGIAVDSAGTILLLTDVDRSHPTVGDSAQVSVVTAFWVRGQQRGGIGISRTSLSAMKAHIESGLAAGSVTVPPSSTTSRSDPPRELTESELEQAKRLAEWLKANRCPLRPPPRPPTR